MIFLSSSVKPQISYYSVSVSNPRQNNASCDIFYFFIYCCYGRQLIWIQLSVRTFFLSNVSVHYFYQIMRVFALGIIPMTATMPQSVFMYWATNNSISITQSLLMKRKDVKKYFGIMDPPPPDPTQVVVSPFALFQEVRVKYLYYSSSRSALFLNIWFCLHIFSCVFVGEMMLHSIILHSTIISPSVKPPTVCSLYCFILSSLISK